MKKLIAHSSPQGRTILGTIASIFFYLTQYSSTLWRSCSRMIFHKVEQYYISQYILKSIFKSIQKLPEVETTKKDIAKIAKNNIYKN